MKGERQPLERGTAAALKTIYPPELDAQQRFDALVEQLKPKPYRSEATDAVVKG